MEIEYKRNDLFLQNLMSGDVFRFMSNKQLESIYMCCIDGRRGPADEMDFIFIDLATGFYYSSKDIDSASVVELLDTKLIVSR